MAAVAPCAQYGCNCGQWNHLAFQSGRPGHAGHAPQGPPVNLRLRQVLLELKPFEEKARDAHQLVQHMSADQVGPCVKAILEQPVPIPWMHGLSLQILGQLLHLHPAIVTSEFGKRNMSWLFPEQGDVDAAAMFLRNLLWNKQALGQNTRSEAGKFERILLKRTRQNDLCRVPACSARTWLAQIWKDVSSTRPKSDLLVSCMVRWLADQYERPEGKATCLEILQEEASRRTAADLEAWAVSLIFQEVCRQPMMHSADLQQLLLLGEERLHFCLPFYPFLVDIQRIHCFLVFLFFSHNLMLETATRARCLLHRPPSASVVRSLLGLSRDEGYLMSLWTCLCNWAPQAPWFTAPAWCYAGPPLYALLRSVLVAFSQLADSKKLCRSALMALAALGTSNSSISSQVPTTLLMLFREGPVLPAEVWMPLAPLLGYLSQYSPQAAELGSRLRALASGGFSSAPHLGAQPHQPCHMAHMQNGPAQAGLSSFATAPVPPGNPYYQGQMVGQEWHMGQGQPWPQQQHPHYSQTNGSQGPAAQGSMRPLATGTQFAPLAADKSKVVAHKPPSVGLQNTNNTCYMNSFVQALFLTDAFVWRIYSFSLKLKENPSTIDKEDFEFGKTVVELLRKQFAKMALTKHKHTDIWDILQAFPADYRSGEQQDVTETIRFVFDKLGGTDQALLKEVFAGELEEKIQCRDCGNIKVRKETFTDLVVPVPTAKEAQESGYVPTMQQLLEERLKSEEMDDADNLVTCDICERKTRAVKWSEITTPPAHLCLCLNRFTFNMETFNFTKEKTPVKVDEGLSIGGYVYELYHTIIHTGKDASSGHYYAMGKRSEPTPSGDSGWYTMDDSQIKPADVSLLAGNPPEKLLDDNAYVLFLRCKQAPPTPEFRIPSSLFDYVKKEDKKQWGELNRAVKTMSEAIRLPVSSEFHHVSQPTQFDLWLGPTSRKGACWAVHHFRLSNAKRCSVLGMWHNATCESWAESCFNDYHLVIKHEYWKITCIWV